jgi:hypothetical protein
MSGGSYDYFYLDLANFIEEYEAEIVGKDYSESNTRARKVFMDHLKLVQKCLEQIELVDSSDAEIDSDMNEIIRYYFYSTLTADQLQVNFVNPKAEKQIEALKRLGKSDSHLEAVRKQLNSFQLEIAKVHDLFEED